MLVRRTSKQHILEAEARATEPWDTGSIQGPCKDQILGDTFAEVEVAFALPMLPILHSLRSVTW